MNQKLNEKVKIHKHFNDKESLNKFLKSLDINNSAILIKGSRGMKMEEFVSIIESTKK